MPKNCFLRIKSLCLFRHHFSIFCFLSDTRKKVNGPPDTYLSGFLSFQNDLAREVSEAFGVLCSICFCVLLRALLSILCRTTGSISVVEEVESWLQPCLYWCGTESTCPLCSALSMNHCFFYLQLEEAGRHLRVIYEIGATNNARLSMSCLW